MSLSIQHNITASTVADKLSAHFSRLAVSTRRLSSGLRVSSAADDAAGLAIRELIRNDIAAMSQGLRNVNDAISMLQVADGALAIIDEKLIRMKELAEQAATGTYDSTQRLMIDSEFQAMGAEIDRISRATDFNGIKLLDGSLSGNHDGSALKSKGALKIHFGTGNDSAEDYYYARIGNCGTKGLGLHDEIGERPEKPAPTVTLKLRDDVPAWMSSADATVNLQRKTVVLYVAHRLSGEEDNSPNAVPGLPGMDYYELPSGLENVRIESNTTASNYAHKPHVNIFNRMGWQFTGINPTLNYTPRQGPTESGQKWWSDKSASQIINALKDNGLVDQSASYNGNRIINNCGQSVMAAGALISIESSMQEREGAEVITIDKINSELVFLIGGHSGPTSNNCNHYSLRISATLSDDYFVEEIQEAPSQEEAELPSALLNIGTQEKAQNALARISNAIVEKDKTRASLGALQNRLENTASNLSIQMESLGAAESRISDADIALEMTQFVRNQILTQSAVAMLTQANSMPQMVMRLIG